jgi:hypothetical protein
MNLVGQACWPVACLAIACFSLSGCGSGGSGGKASPAAAEKSAGAIKRRTADELEPIGDYLPPLDDGRIEIAPPAEWKPMPRDARYLARFVKGKVSELPRITVTVWDTPLPAITELTEANAGQLAAELITQLKKDKKTVPEPPKPIVLGETLFLRHVRLAKLPSGGNVVVQALDTVRGGRIYTVELIADVDAPRGDQYEASLKNVRDFGYAVAANLKFTGGDSGASEAPAEPSPPAAGEGKDQPAEANPNP